MTKTTIICNSLLFTAILSVFIYADSFDLTIESIKDSSTLLYKIHVPDDPLYPYFYRGKAPITMADLIAVINSQVLPDPEFAFDATQLDDLKTTDRFESLSPEKQDALLAKNRDLLTELYSNEIVARNPESIKPGFSVKINIIKPDSMQWLKAEVVNFLNELIGNDRILVNWKSMRQFFDENITDKAVKAFSESMRTYEKRKYRLIK